MGTMFNRAKVSFLTSSEQLGYKILTQCPPPPLTRMQQRVKSDFSSIDERNRCWCWEKLEKYMSF